MLLLLPTLLALVGFTGGTPLADPNNVEVRAVAPTVKLDAATVTGFTSGKTSSFLGLPYAKPPTGDLRFRLPVANAPYTGSVKGTNFGLACPQQPIDLPIIDGLAGEAVDFLVNSIYGVVFPDSEDCLFINVIKPASATASSKLPVAAWIFGGGFELGDPKLYDGKTVVERSIQMGSPVVYVSMNYRVGGFGFLASKEVKEAGVGNLGLQDQREALRWIQKYIGAFGGDPSKVTIWGESAGAISVALQMVTNGGNTEGLFRGGFMQSGSPIPVGDITNGQKYYDAITASTGCASAVDSLDCLRKLPYAKLKNAVDASPGLFSYKSLILTWLPRVDGTFIKDNPQQLVLQGSVANIPFVNGDCDDEGTLFSLSTLNITDNAKFNKYIRSEWLPRANSADVDKLMNLYPDSRSAGSPFGTGILNALTSQSKRMAAFQGDAVFQAPRRFFLEQLSGKVPTWSFISKRFKVLPILGSAHLTDILNVYGGGEMADYLINFVNKLDPNGNTVDTWPKYTVAKRQILAFHDGLLFRIRIEVDDFRKEAIAFLMKVTMTNTI